MDVKVYLNTLRQKGNLAYEYNPLHNYQTDEDLYIVDSKYIIPAGKAINLSNGEILTKKEFKIKTAGGQDEILYKWVDKRGTIISENIKTTEDGELWAKAGSLIDLDTDLLNFDLEHPVEIEVLPSYDGSVNLILNDDKNIPRLINSRFSVREKDTYEIVDRIGENDTNIYNSKTFEKDTSLYFQNESNPIITFLGYGKGNLPVGLYCFYLTYCDADNNESDYISESGLIPVFLGDDKDPHSMDGGIKNLDSNKSISLRLNNLDKSYNYIKVYYVRYFGDYNQNRVVESKKLLKKFSVSSDNVYLSIVGTEDTEDIDPTILNITLFNPKNILTQALCKNMLFFGNIVKNEDNYKELSDLALRIVPSLNDILNFDLLDKDYNSELNDFAYYNSLNMYNKVGYFNLEYYRFGVVFIYTNGNLSRVYNTLGGILDNNKSLKLSGNVQSLNNSVLIRNYIKIDENGWVKPGDYTIEGEQINARGVCFLNFNKSYNDKTIFSIKFTIPEEVSEYLKNELNVRGLFFVRQKCVPNILTQCYLLPFDELLQSPIIEYKGSDGLKRVTECFISLYEFSHTKWEKDRPFGPAIRKDIYKDGRLLTDYNQRLYTYSKEPSIKAYAAICPDFLLNLSYYNQIFNGASFRLNKISSSNSELVKNQRFYSENEGVTYQTTSINQKVNICAVTEAVPTVAIKDITYKLTIGQPEEVFRFKYAEVDNGTYNIGDDSDYIKKDGSYGDALDKINEATNLVRGQYSPYLAVYSESSLDTSCLYNIYSGNSQSMLQEFQTRMNSSEAFYAISDRYNLITKDKSYECFRGDCYINLFTYRLNRNFNDPSLPNNDLIIDIETWKNNYDVKDNTKWKNISRSDINAVKLGSWITFKVRSSMNYALRSVDHSYVSEEALMGAPRSFYPRSYLLEKGANKMPDSYLYNDAYRASLGYKCYFTLQDVNYVKDTFSNRIQYSAVAILDSYKNNYRYSLSTYYRDYSNEYGSILKLLEYNGDLLVIFEHGIGLAKINERILTGGGENDPVFINSLNVLPEQLMIISDTYGTLWGDSVVKSDAGIVYGVDTIAKKIWRFNGRLELISDFKVNKFLVDNITLGERELLPTIGLKNVKTHYNANKRDIIFTFYDDVYKDEEKAWSLCYNELLECFVTFYSWIPSYSANIDTKFFTFNRNTAKELALLLKSNYSIPENTGVLIDSPILKTLDSEATLYYASPEHSALANYTMLNPDGTTSIKSVGISTSSENGMNLVKGVSFKLEKDHWQNYNLFTITSESDDTLKNKLIPKEGRLDDLRKAFENQKVILLYVTPYMTQTDTTNIITGTNQQVQFKTELIALTLDSILNNPMLTGEEKNKAGLTTDFYLHGQSGIFDVAENLYPTYWYGEYHPFEFEFVVNDKIGYLKVFNNLILISNKAEPESFHFEIEGDNYEFSSDKRNMYFRLEATKNLYLNLGSDILYNRSYTDVAATKYTLETYYRPKTNGEVVHITGDDNDSFRFKPIYEEYPIHYHDGLVQLVKSTIFPLYYERIDTYNDIYHKYHLMHSSDATYDFQNLSGSEITWDRDSNLFNIVTHIKNNQIDLVGRLRGNSRYKEGKWTILIPSITFMLKNEQLWAEVSTYSPLLEEGPLKLASSTYKIPPIVINSLYVPKDLKNNNIELKTLPNIYTGRLSSINDYVQYTEYEKYNTSPSIYDYVDTSEWTARKETRIRDKWMKVRIRYSGKNLAIIHSVATLYNLSYS